ncbi:MAG: methyl-accepting chemotaxis sensory transducer [Herbinix sp.]|jgi:methyl-accepting chemotaxis protein|nr:methyl-accepting chemotaxis sensory transducer [Herbinix sp.]
MKIKMDEKYKKNKKMKEKDNSDYHQYNSKNQDAPPNELKFNRTVRNLHTIRSKLILAFLVPVSFIIILGIISYSKSSEGLIGNYEKSTISNLSNMVKYMSFGLNMVEAKANLLNSDNTLKKYYSGFYQKDEVEELSRFREIQELVNSNVLLEDYIENIYMFSNYGNGLSGNGSLNTEFYNKFVADGEGSLFTDETMTSRWIGSHPYIDNQTNKTDDKYAISYIKQLYNISNKPVGYIVLDFSMDFVKDAISSSGLPEGSIIAFVTADGREVIHGEIAEDFKITEQDYYINTIREKKDKEGYEYIEYNEAKYLFVYAKENISNSVLCAFIPKGYIVKQADNMKNITFIIVFIACVIAIVLGTIIASGISSMINKIIVMLQKTAAGDLTNTLMVKRKDEFHILGKSINEMVGSFLNLIKKIISVSETVSKSSVTVADTSTVLMEVTKNISSAVEDIEQGVTQQAGDAESCLHLMMKLADKISEVYRNSDNIEQIASKTKEVIGNGISIVDNLGNKVKITSKVSRTVIMDIEQMESKTIAITKIIETMNDIAEQAKLLSLNAAIEAARAGQAGRGFRVVASEIQKFADKSLTSSKEIEQVVHSIVSQTMKTVNAAKEADALVITQEEALNNTINVFAEINLYVEKLINNLNYISKDIKEIEQAKDDTLNSIENISAASEETAAAAGELGATVEEQLKEVRCLNDVVLQLNEDAKNLDFSINMFKIEG